MKKGFGFVCAVLFCLSCSPDPDAGSATENDSALAADGEEAESVPEKDEAYEAPLEEQPTPKTAPVSQHNNASTDPPPSRPSNDPFYNPFGDGGGGNGSGQGESPPGSAGDAPDHTKLARKQLSDIDPSAFKPKQSTVIRLILSIDANGTVVAASVDKDNTHTSDQVVLDQVIAAVKKEVKYNRVPGAPLTKVNYKVYLEGTEMPEIVH